MIPEQRYRAIRDALAHTGFVSLQDAAAITGASEATLRRDFAELSRRGSVRRHRGGVEAIPDSGDAGVPPCAIGSAPLQSRSLDSRVPLHEAAKRRIAERAAALCRPGITVFLDAGSTTLLVARRIAAMDLRIVTNSFAAARLVLSEGAAEVILTGGQIDRPSEVVHSYLDDQIVSNYPADIAFLGAEGIDASGVTNSDDRLIRLERLAATVARRAIVVADSSKFGVRGRFRLCGLEEIDAVITDAAIKDEHRELVQTANCMVMEA